MIIYVQAFTARSDDALRIYQELDDFQSRHPTDVIRKNRPILILDEPQKMEGKATTKKLAEFVPLMIPRYSAKRGINSVGSGGQRRRLITARNTMPASHQHYIRHGHHTVNFPLFHPRLDLPTSRLPDHESSRFSQRYLIISAISGPRIIGFDAR